VKIFIDQEGLNITTSGFALRRGHRKERDTTACAYIGAADPVLEISSIGNTASVIHADR
jgi:hypothetical protein